MFVWVSPKLIRLDAKAPRLAKSSQYVMWYIHYYHFTKTQHNVLINWIYSINVTLIYIKYIGYSILMACFQITLFADASVVPLFTAFRDRDSSNHSRWDSEDMWRAGIVQAHTKRKHIRNKAVVQAGYNHGSKIIRTSGTEKFSTKYKEGKESEDKNHIYLKRNAQLDAIKPALRAWVVLPSWP